MKISLIFLFTLKACFISQWLARSIYLALQTTPGLSGSIYWNLTTSIVLLAFDVFFTLRLQKDFSLSRQKDKLLFMLGGPILFILASIGGIMNYVSYNDVVCQQGCLLSELLSDLHKFCLVFVSFAVTVQYFYCGKIGNCEVLRPLVRWTVVSGEFMGCDYVCCICRNCVGGNGNAVRVKACGHMFDEDCLSEWVRIKNECPICRSSLI